MLRSFWLHRFCHSINFLLIFRQIISIQKATSVFSTVANVKNKVSDFDLATDRVRIHRLNSLVDATVAQLNAKDSTSTQ